LLNKKYSNEIKKNKNGLSINRISEEIVKDNKNVEIIKTKNKFNSKKPLALPAYIRQCSSHQECGAKYEEFQLKESIEILINLIKKYGRDKKC